MKKKLIIGGIAIVLLALIGGGTAWLNHAGYIHLYGSHGAGGDGHKEEVSGLDVIENLRKLFAYQDQVAQGDAEALTLQEELTATIAETFQDFKPADWRDPKNVNAMMGYVLSGGSTEVVEKFLLSNVASEEQKNVAKGIRSFALGHSKTAMKQIGGMDPRTVDAPVAGPMAMALASMHVADDSARSLSLYDDARLHSPGTAVEEAALRRQFPILMKSAAFERATMLLARYVRVFPKSLYAPGFLRTSASEISQIDEARAVAMVHALAEALGDENPDKSHVVFLDIAQSAVMAGRVNLAKAAADVVNGMRELADAGKVKAKLYAASATAPTEAAASALGELEALASANLDADDAAVRAAAIVVARTVANASAFNADAAPNKPRQQDGGKGRDALQGADNGVGAIVSRADAAIKKVDEILATGAP